MKKMLMVSILTGTLVLLGAGMVLAGGFGHGDGFQACESAGSPEEALAIRAERLETLVADGVLDQDKADGVLAEMQQRQLDCEQAGEGCQSNERMGVGFGRSSEGRGEFRGEGGGGGRHGSGQGQNRK